MSVRAVGDSELVVEGRQRTPSLNSAGYSSSRAFQQRFVFPGLQVEDVTSSVSSDGVLTITAPKNVS